MKVLVILVVIFMWMGVEYALLSTKIKITGTAGIEGKWDIYISDIREKSMYQATTVTAEVIDKTAANFDVQLEKPGSYAEYEVTVKNHGKLDDVLKAIHKIDENETTSKDIVYSVKDLEVDTLLPASQEVKFIFRVEFMMTATSIPTTSSSATLSLDYEQVTGINHPSDMVSAPTYMVDKRGWQQEKTVTISSPERTTGMII